MPSIISTLSLLIPSREAKDSSNSPTSDSPRCWTPYSSQLDQELAELSLCFESISLSRISSQKGLISPPVSKVSSSCSSAPCTPKTSVNPAINRWNNIIGSTTDWPRILSSLDSTSRTRMDSDFYSKILDRKLPGIDFFMLVNHYLKKDASGKDVSGKDDRACNRCGLEETIEHFLFECKLAQDFWIKIATILYRLFKQSYVQPTLADIVYLFPNMKLEGSHDLHKLGVLHAAALNALWSCRNSVHIDEGLLVMRFFEARVSACLELELIGSSDFVNGRSMNFESVWKKNVVIEGTRVKLF